MIKRLKNISLSLFVFLKIYKIFNYLNRNKALVLMYHGFTAKAKYDAFENIENIHLDIAKFEKQIKFLTSNFNVISLNTLVECFEQKKAFPSKSVVITVDDGYESNYKLAFEILKRYNCPAIIFLTTNFVNDSKILWTDRLAVLIKKLQVEEFEFSHNGQSLKVKLNDQRDKLDLYKKFKKILKNIDQVQRDDIIEQIIKKYAIKIEPNDYSEMNLPLNWDQIREMNKSSIIEFGGHTCSHYIIGKLSADIAREEVIQSTKIIEEKTGKKCLHFCYPNGQPGDFNKVTKNILIDSGYKCGLTTIQNYVTEKSDVYELERIYVSNKDSINQFVMSLSGMRF